MHEGESIRKTRNELLYKARTNEYYQIEKS
jgi:hypothetical protein